MTDVVDHDLDAAAGLEALDDPKRPMTLEEKAAYRERRERRARRAAKTAARQSSLADDPFVELLGQADEMFRDKRWDDLSRLGQATLFKNRNLKRFMVIAGRGALYHGAVAKGVRILDAADALFPDDREIAFYRGVGCVKNQSHDAAIAIFRDLMAAQWNPKRVRAELAPALAMKLREEPQNEDILQELLVEIREVILTPRATVTPDIATVLQRYGHGDEAIALVDKLVSERPDHRRTLETKAKILIEQSRIAEAVAVSHDILARWPDNPIAQFNIRVLGAIASDAAQRPQTFGAITLTTGRFELRRLGADADAEDQVASADHPGELLAAADVDWIVVGKSGAEIAFGIDPLRRAVRNTDGVGYVSLNKTTDLWRRDAIADLLESGRVEDPQNLWEALAAHRRFYGLTLSRAPDDRGVAVIMSKHGSVKFGGGEHFIASMADHYASMGYRPLILGCRPELIGESGQVDGHDYIHIENSPAAMRALFLDRDVSLVHSLSSIGYEAAQALRLTNIPFVYGIHFWSDALGGGLDKAYFDAEGAPIPRPEFSYIVARAQTVYTNSAFTQRVIEQAHGMRCPVIFSVPEEAAA